MTLVVDIIFFLLKNKRERKQQTHEQTIYRKSSIAGFQCHAIQN